VLFGHRVYTAALISVFSVVSQTPACTARPQPVHRATCLFTSHFSQTVTATVSRTDGQVELTWVAVD